MANERDTADELERLNQEAKGIAQLIDDALHTLEETHQGGQWPYKVEPGKAQGAAWDIRGSASTTAMVAFALAAVDGRFGPEELLVEPTNHRPIDERAGAAARAKIVTKASQWLRDELADKNSGQVRAEASTELTTVLDGVVRLIAMHDGDEYRSVHGRLSDAQEMLDSLGRTGSGPTTRSSLFGRDDPLTLYWSLALLELEGTSPDDGPCTRLRAAACEVIKRARELSEFTLNADQKGGVIQVPHPWVHLRLLLLAIRQKLDGGFDRDKVTQYLLDVIAKQISWRDIRDSNFDEASLIFALEAALLWAPRSVTPGLLERATQVIAEDASNPSLQSRQPFKVTDTGGVHIPINVEVASSLLRVCTRAREEFDNDDVFLAVLPVLRRYVAWVRATVTLVSTRGLHLTGWRSDHEYFAAPHIETWYTSQIALFLHNYREALLTHVAARGLARERLSPVRPQADSEKAGAQLLERDARDPLFGPRGQPFTTMLRDFVAERRTSSPAPACSMLLYGPPGTGKSSSVRLLASALEWPTTIITPSNFITHGEQQVEATAKALFDVLEMQSNMVVLFDEIDRLILDRRNADYHRQGDMFQLMTPSMLTKLETLRRRAQVIFVIATNYGYRIDPAIIRPGRIDRQFLILPPDLAQRQGLLAAALPKDVRDEAAGPLAKRTPLYTGAEITALVDEFGKTTGDLRSRCDQAVRIVTPAIRLDDYRPDTASHGDNPLFLAETASVGAILAEVGANVRVDRSLAETWQRQREIVEAMLGDAACEQLVDWTRTKTS